MPMIIESLMDEYQEFKRFLRNLGLVVRMGFALGALAINVACAKEPTLAELSASPPLACQTLRLEEIAKEYPHRTPADYAFFRRERLVALNATDAQIAGECLTHLCAQGDEGACVDIAYVDLKYGASAELRATGLKNLERACHATKFPACDVVGLELRDRGEYARALPYLTKECIESTQLTTTYMCEFAGEAAEELKDLKAAEVNYRRACERSDRFGDCSYLAGFYVRRREYQKAKPILRKECFGAGYTSFCTELARIHLRERNVEEFRAVASHTCRNRELVDPAHLAELGSALQRMGQKRDALGCLEKSCGPDSQDGCQELEALYRAENQNDLAEVARKRALEARKKTQCYPASRV